MKRQSVYIPRYQGYVKMGKQSIPDNATFLVLGSAGPLEKRQQAETKIAALSGITSLEQMKAETQQGRPLNLAKIQEDMLTTAGVPESSVDDYFLEEQQPIPGQPQGPQNVQ